MWKSAALALGLAVAATPVVACVAPPPPNFHGWLNDPSVAMFVGRVDRVEVFPPQESGGLIVVPGAAHVVALETIQGRPSVDTARVDGVLEIRQPPDRVAGPPGCPNYLDHKVGDLVIVVQPTPAYVRPLVYGRRWATLPQLTPFIEKHL